MQKVLNAEQRKVMYERYTMIAPILPFVSDDRLRSKLICSIAEDHQVSKQTIRNYLCFYLVYMDITALAPKKRKTDRELTQDEKNIRWALNKFFYTTANQSLYVNVHLRSLIMTRYSGRFPKTGRKKYRRKKYFLARCKDAFG